MNINTVTLAYYSPTKTTRTILQGIAEVSRCISCIKTGAYPPRLHDVEETETMILNQHEDIEVVEEKLGEIK